MLRNISRNTNLVKRSLSIATHSSSDMKIAVCQYPPVFQDIKSNERKVDLMVEWLRPGEVQALVLPEMCFTGYCFKDKEHIRPYLETIDGPTVQWCKKQAQRLQSYVFAGFPQIVEEDGQTRYYNSMCVVSPQGELVHVYHKNYLYDTDKTWAQGGEGFITLDLKGLGKVGLGICMDLNEQDFRPTADFAFANHNKQNEADIIIASMAWIDSHPHRDDNEGFTQQYWADRLSPLLGKNAEKECVFIAANRTGAEQGTTFVGSSCVIDLKNRAMLGSMGKRDEGLLVVDFPDPAAADVS